MCMGEWPSAPIHLCASDCVHQFMGRFMENHFISLKFEPALGKILFNNSRLVVDSEPTVGLELTVMCVLFLLT